MKRHTRVIAYYPQYFHYVAADGSQGFVDLGVPLKGEPINVGTCGGANEGLSRALADCVFLFCRLSCHEKRVSVDACRILITLRTTKNAYMEPFFFLFMHGARLVRITQTFNARRSCESFRVLFFSIG